MSLILLTPPAGEPVTLADVKAHLRILHDDEDALIASFIAAARRTIEARAGLAILSQVWRLSLDAPPASILRLPLAPVAAIAGVSVATGPQDEETVDPSGYDLAPGSPGRLRVRGLWPAPEPGVGGVRIDFEAGWATADAAPADLLQAVRILTAHYYENREAAAGGRTLAPVDALIAPYRQVRL